MEMPSYGMGTYTLVGDNCTDIISNGLRLGYKMIDTAELYSNHKEISDALELVNYDSGIKREDIWITSKIHNRDQRKLNIAQAIDKILKDLNTDYLDLILLHSAQKNYAKAYEELIRVGSHFNLRHIGVSNFRIDELETIISNTNIKPFLNQIEISPFVKRTELRSYMTTNNILAQAYGSLTCAKNFSSPHLDDPSYRPDELLLGWATHYNLRPIPTNHTIDHLYINYNTLERQRLPYTNIYKLDEITDQFINFKQHSDKF
jgi:diketogulonate reductase-like aldo/keto reductase